MRSTIHLVSARDYWPLALDRRAPAPRLVAEGQPRRPRRARHERRGAARCARGSPGGTLRRGEVEQLHRQARRPPAIGHWLHIVRAPPSGTWERRRADLYALAEDWLGAAGDRPRRRRRPHRAALPRRLRPRHARRDRQLGRRPGAHAWRRPSSACGCAASRPRTARSWSTSRARRCPTPRRRRPSGCSGPGTRSCSPTPAARTSCPSASATRVFHVRMPQSVTDLPRRRRGRGHLALRGRARDLRALRAPRPRDAARAARGGRADGGVVR